MARSASSPPVGLGGLGHMAVKLAHALGAKVSVLSQSLKKQEDGLRLGADHSYATSDAEIFTTLAGIFDLIHQHRQRRPGSRRLPGATGRRRGAGQRRGTRETLVAERLLAAHQRPLDHRVHDRRHHRNPGDARLLRRARCGRRDRNDLGRQDQRRLRAGTGLRRALPRRHRDRHPRSPAR